MFITFFKKLLHTKFFFNIPSRCDFIIYTDKEKERFFDNLIPNKEIFYIYRFDYGINIFFLILCSIVYFHKKITFKEKYFLFISRFYKPKIIITTYDNEIFFYKLRYITNIDTCIIQNGYRAYYVDVFSKIEKVNIKNFNVTYKFLYGPSIGKLYDKYLPGKNIYIGSFKNNFIEQSESKKNTTSIGYISQFRNVKDYLPEVDVINFLNKYCNENDFQLNVHLLGSSKVFGRAAKILKPELNFYQNHLNCKNKIIIRNDSLDNYRSLMNENIIVNIDSTLGYEMLARRKKIIFFSFRDSNKKYFGCCDEKSHNFGWPTKYENTGLCWSNIYDESVLRKILDNAITCETNLWKKKITEYADNLIKYDYNNNEIKKIINQINER